MNFRKNLKLSPSFSINIVPLVDVVFLVASFFILSVYFIKPASINVRLPKAVTSDAINEKNIDIIITSENVIYFGGQIATMDELRIFLSQPQNKKRPVLIKADRRASVGRIGDVWNLSRRLGIEKVNIATDQE